MKLGHLSDQDLLRVTKDLVRKESKLKTSILYHLKEIESRRLFCELGYSSLYAYAVRELKYSESAAMRRIQASRMLFDVPDLAEKIEKGTLTLANVSQASRYFSENKISKRAEKRKVLKSLENKTRSDGEKVLFVLSGIQEAPTKETIKRNSAKSHELRFSLNEDAFQKLDDLRGLLAHRGKHRLEEVFEYSLDRAIEVLKKEKFKLEPNSRRIGKESSETRYIPARVKRRVFERDKGRCTNCGSKHKLEFDHIIPFSMGGKTCGKNLRLLCFSCNQRLRIRHEFKESIVRSQ